MPSLDAPLLERVELLERSLAYTNVALGGVAGSSLDRPTPCRRWTLGVLLAHMEDALDAFLEAAGGAVTVELPAPDPTRVPTLRDKACALLAAWLEAPPTTVRVGGTMLDGSLLLGTAALEIAVHGWDVARAIGQHHPVPPALARDLLSVAHLVVGSADRGVRFAAPVDPGHRPGAEAQLIAFLGREPAAT